MHHHKRASLYVHTPAGKDIPACGGQDFLVFTACLALRRLGLDCIWLQYVLEMIAKALSHSVDQAGSELRSTRLCPPKACATMNADAGRDQRLLSPALE